MVRKICVLGAGIIGLYSAVRTLEDLQNVDVTVIAEKFSPNNTTDVAAGFWHPYRMGSTNPSLIKRWSDETFKYLLNLHESPMASELGIQLVSGYYLNSRETNPFWKDTVFNLRDLTPEENKLFPNYTNNKFFTSLIVCGTLYMQWLMERFISLGGKVKSKRLESLSEVNAPWIKHFYIVSGLSKPVFIFPSKNYVVMGGTDQEGNWDTTPNEEDQRHILDSCAQVVPSLKNVEILETRVGLRPFRKQTRLDQEIVTFNGRTKQVINNYGHGGCGLTTFVGCAKDVVAMIREAGVAPRYGAKL
eukprot:XP_014775781.1 PREDICTED: D-amino-acid oxidase-like isoform X2 [Octopus bimaculoides]